MRLWMAIVGLALGLCAPSLTQARSSILLDNDSVTVSLNTYSPGELSGEHTHSAPRFVYVISEGTLESTEGDQPPQTFALATGSCMYAAPVRHRTQNTGETTLRMVEVEIKNATWGSSAPNQPCTALPLEKPRSHRLQRQLLFAGPDLVVSRIVIPPGSRDGAGSIRGPRLVIVLDGGSLATRLPNGSKAIATREAALWVDEEAPLVNLDDHAPLTVLELTPSTLGKDAEPRPVATDGDLPEAKAHRRHR